MNINLMETVLKYPDTPEVKSNNQVEKLERWISCPCGSGEPATRTHKSQAETEQVEKVL